jgi:lipid-A-disaccharide synthase
VWAWRPWRAAKLAKRIDHLMCLLPFEPPYFDVHGLKTTFVGHPVIEMDWAPDYQKLDVRDDGRKILCLLPGSRAGEIKRHLTIFAQAAGMLPDVKIVVPTFKKFVPIIKTVLPHAVVVTDPILKRQALIQSDVALAASGTVSLELAMAKTPMIIAYRVSWLTAKILKRLINVSSICLINILLGKKVVSECLQNDCNPEHLKDAVQLALDYVNRASYDSKASALFDEVRAKLIPNSEQKPSERAAEVVLRYVSKVC